MSEALDMAEGLLTGKLSPASILSRRPDFFADSFAEQIAWARDVSPFKSAFCTRRAAKSFSVGLEMVEDSYDFPRAHYLLLMTTRAQAKRDFWLDVLQAINNKHQLGMRFNESELIATMPNEAKIYVGGADSSKDEWRKLIAGKYRKVHVDEAQAFIHTDLRTLVYDAFKPAVGDYRGTIGMSGTAGIIASGFFFDVTQGKEAGWSRHEWDYQKNTTIGPKGKRICDEIEAEVQELKRLRPNVEQEPFFRRNYRREWVTDDTEKVYRYTRTLNDFDGALPAYPVGEWHYLLGVDLGWKDPTSFQVGAYHDHDPRLYLLRAEKEAGLDLTAVAARSKALDRLFNFEAWMVDGANKQAVEEMVRRHDCPWEASDKTGKSDFIELMNADFLAGLIMLSPQCEPLRAEYANLIWDQAKMVKQRKREEHAGCQNHCADGALYLWRKAYSYLSTARSEIAAMASDEWQQEQADEMRRTAEDAARERIAEREDQWAA